MKAKIFNLQKFSLNDGPGIRTTVFFSGCNLNCRWCANPECHLSEAEGARKIEADELLEELLKDKPFYDKSGGGVTFSGGEALLQPELVSELTRRLHQFGISAAIETAGNIDDSDGAFSARIADFDYVFMDLKHWDDAAHRRGTGVSNRFILENIFTLAALGKDYCIRIPVIPGYNDSIEDARRFASLLAQLKVKNAELMPFHQFGERKYARYALPYAYAGVPQLHRESLTAYLAEFTARGIPCKMD